MTNIDKIEKNSSVNPGESIELFTDTFLSPL